jgi:type VI secretion system protein ImpM
VSDFPSGCLGKLPLHGDFIRLNAAGPEVYELDHWIQEGIVQGYNELDSRWDSTFDAAPPARFIYVSPRGQKVLAGLFRPSVDRAGRRFPFLIYALIDATAISKDVGLLPFAMQPFLARANELVSFAGSAANLNMYLSSFESLRLALDLGEARRNFARFVLARTSGETWTASFGAATDDRRYSAMQAISEGADMRQGQSLMVRIPLVEPEPEAAFWIELARRLSKDGRAPTLAMWNEASGSEGGIATQPRLHLAFGDLKARSFLPFVLPQRQSAELLDFGSEAARGHALARHGESKFHEALNQPDLKLSDLLQRLPRLKLV